MNRFVFFILLISMNCASGPVHGFLFTYNDYAGEMNSDRTIPASVQAMGCQYSVLGLMSFGNSGAGQIAYNKGIKRISSIDYSTLSILTIFFNRNCTIVTGATY